MKIIDIKKTLILKRIIPNLLIAVLSLIVSPELITQEKITTVGNGKTIL